MSGEILEENSQQIIPHVNVIICTPGHSVMTGYIKSLLATIQEFNKLGITWAFSQEYSSHVGDAREMTLNGDNHNIISEVRPFKGQITYDKLLWIDSDIMWEPEQALKLYESDKDIVSGAYLLATGEVTAYPKSLKGGYTYEDVLKMEEPIEVSAIGFGFVCVKQGVFESLKRPWFQSVLVAWDDEETGESFPFAMMGEDMSWCENVKRAGFTIWLDPSIKVIHHKVMKLTWEGPRP